MFSTSAVQRTTVLLSAMLGMTAAWGFLRLPGANMLMVVFTFLTSAFLMDVSSFRRRLKMTVILSLYASAVQFLITVWTEFPLGQMIAATFSAYFVFSTLPDLRAGCIVMITGYLAFFAPCISEEAVSRSMDILIGGAVVMIVTTLCHARKTDQSQVTVSPSPVSRRRCFYLAAALGTGNLLFRLLQLQQGPWIMLTVLFITMAETPENPGKKLAFQRIFAVPAGILFGGFLLETFSRTDQRLVYLIPFLGAIGFFLLYDQGDFFLFSLFFMVTLTFFSDWMTGPYHRFHFWDILFSRTLSSFLGAICFLIFNFYGTRRTV